MCDHYSPLSFSSRDLQPVLTTAWALKSDFRFVVLPDSPHTENCAKPPAFIGIQHNINTHGLFGVCVCVWTSWLEASCNSLARPLTQWNINDNNQHHTMPFAGPKLAFIMAAHGPKDLRTHPQAAPPRLSAPGLSDLITTARMSAGVPIAALLPNIPVETGVTRTHAHTLTHIHTPCWVCVWGGGGAWEKMWPPWQSGDFPVCSGTLKGKHSHSSRLAKGQGERERGARALCTLTAAALCPALPTPSPLMIWAALIQPPPHPTPHRHTHLASKC